MPRTPANQAARPIVPAVISDQQLGGLIELLRAHEQRNGTRMISHVRGVIGRAPFVIDLRVCPIALAAVAARFDHDPSVIAIIDEAHFEQLLVTVSQAYPTGDIVMTLSSHPDVVSALNKPAELAEN